MASFGRRSVRTGWERATIALKRRDSERAPLRSIGRAAGAHCGRHGDLLAGLLHTGACMNRDPNIRRILVAYDFSETADYALGYARGIAEKFGARMTVVHVSDADVFSYPDAFMANFDGAAEAERVATDALERVVEKSRGAKVEVEAALRRGSAWKAITALASEIRADLIVMGTHGRRGIARAALGSVAETVVRVSTCPVLTVHLPDARTTQVGTATDTAGARS
jgi:nucleotide-binding universal stress UspA family protein